MIEAVALENEANFPRLLCSDKLLAHLAAGRLDPVEHKMVIEDQLGRKIANPFVPGIKVPDRSLRDFYNEVWNLPKIESVIASELSKCVAASSHRHAEKWRYMQDVLPPMLQTLDEEAFSRRLSADKAENA